MTWIAPSPLPRSCPVAALADLRMVVDRIAAWDGFADMDYAAHASCDGAAILVVETARAGGDTTWVLTTAPDGRLRLEAMVDESYLDLVAEGPVDRILAYLGTMVARPRVVA